MNGKEVGRAENMASELAGADYWTCAQGDGRFW